MRRPRSNAVVLLFLALSLPSLLSSGPQAAWAQSQPSDASVMVSLDQRTPASTAEPDAEQQLLQLLNAVRTDHGLPALRMDRSLQAAARTHSREMATGGYVGHGSLSGASALERLSHVVSRGYVGENVTFGLNCHVVHRALVASPGHLQNILEPRFHRVGIGVFSAGALGMAVTQDFAE